MLHLHGVDLLEKIRRMPLDVNRVPHLQGALGQLHDGDVDPGKKMGDAADLFDEVYLALQVGAEGGRRDGKLCAALLHHALQASQDGRLLGGRHA